jgi:hypothetical protein
VVLRNCVFFSARHAGRVCFLCFLQQTAVVDLNGISRLVPVKEAQFLDEYAVLRGAKINLVMSVGPSLSVRAHEATRLPLGEFS